MIANTIAAILAPFILSKPSSADYLVVAGGGSGTTSGTFGGGGGGAGGLKTSTAFSLPASFTVTVGAGGAVASVGNNSVFSSITSTGGGIGATYKASGGAGGSGGGAGGRGTGYTGGAASSNKIAFAM
jgi:hypothetical protein